MLATNDTRSFIRHDTSNLTFHTTTPPASLYFPLSVDCLLTLIEFNVFRAFLTNLSVLSLLSTMCDDFSRLTLQPMPSNIPKSLKPTELQKTTPHDPWMDTFPLATMRDNLVSASLAGTLDSDAFCSDVLGSLFRGYTGSAKRGLIVWAEPWDIGAWEITEEFARKWAFLLKGCAELIEGTNRWRALRDEAPLFVEV